MYDAYTFSKIHRRFILMDFPATPKNEQKRNHIYKTRGENDSTLPPSTIKRFLKDLKDGFCAYPIWVTLGWKDIRSRYQRSFLGPLWITFSLAVTVSMMGFLYGALLHQKLSEYLPYLSSGMVIWSLISISLNESTSIFIKSSGIIRQIRLPLSLHILRSIVKNLIIFFHNFIVFIIVALIFHVHLTWSIVLFPLALLLLVMNILWVGLFLGTVCARFRDIEPIVASLVQVLFFITPVIWLPSGLGTRAWLSQLNPLTQYMNILRDPLLGKTPSMDSWIFVVVLTFFGWILTTILLSKYRARVAYWI